MAKLSKDEFNTKYSEMITDNDDLLISLMEDFEDSISSDESSELEDLRIQLENSVNEVAELKKKYKERFLSAVEKKEEKEDDLIEEQEVIDIKEI